ncbi:MAG TPA: serpin family protein [Solirubrobacteraceae bacterium]|nr:serpin family protein [Solirubrobacteraceae bacterium]
MIPARARWRRRTGRAAALAAIVAALAACASAASALVARPARATAPVTRPARATAPVTRPARAAAPVTRPARAAAAIPSAVRASESLGLALLNRLGHGAGNVVFSPYSIETALSMVGEGARGSTARQIDHVLLTRSPAAVAAGLAALNRRLTAASTAPNAPRVDVANGLWVQSGLVLRQPFTEALATLFRAPPQLTDFAGAPETARQAINAWVAARTENRIGNLFPPGTITHQTAAVLANAIYLAAHWAHPFTPSRTAPGPFYPGAGAPVHVPFMTDGAGAPVHVPFMTEAPTEFAYARRAGYRAIDLPYLSSTLSMLLVMPAPGTLASFERALTGRGLARVERSLSPRRVDLRVPRFELKFDTALNAVLSHLGMPIAFTNGANFSGITAPTQLKIAAVEHAADLKVDEQGTVAAAATGIGLVPTSIMVGPTTRLTLDHPFLAFLRDDATGAILFVA